MHVNAKCVEKEARRTRKKHARVEKTDKKFTITWNSLLAY
jgi:hypothetical protein